MAEIDDLKMILQNADVSCITDAKTNAEQKTRFGECIIFVSSLERREAEIRAKAIEEFAERLRQECLNNVYHEVWLHTILKIAKELKGE